MILVTGATGTVGREVVAQLLGAGQPVRGMTRNPTKAKFDPRVEVVQGDFADADSLAKAVNGADRVFSLTLGPQTGSHERALAAAAKKAGVRRIVKLGAMGGDGETRNAIRRWHEEGEQAIRESGIPWTVVRPGRFMSNALHWRESIRRQGKVFSNYGDGKLPSVHPRDIAAVAVRALTSAECFGKALEVTGPVALSMPRKSPSCQIRSVCRSNMSRLRMTRRAKTWNEPICPPTLSMVCYHLLNLYAAARPPESFPRWKRSRGDRR